MSTSLLYHTQCVVGFQHECFDFSEGKVIQHIKRQKIKCPCCRHESISAYPLRERMVQSLPYGNKPTFLKFTVHRIYCPRCGKEYEISAQIRYGTCNSIGCVINYLCCLLALFGLLGYFATCITVQA